MTKKAPTAVAMAPVTHKDDDFQNLSDAEIHEIISGSLASFPPNEIIALQCFSILKSRTPLNAELLESFGEFLVGSGGNLKQLLGGPRNVAIAAASMLQQSIELEPESSGLKYFCMGQLFCGKESVAYFNKAVAVEEKILNESESERESESLHRHRLSQIYCSLCTLYMTDLSDEDDAQTCVEEFSNKAILSCATFSSHSNRALYSKIVGKIDEAKEHCVKAIALLGEMVANMSIGNIQDESKESGQGQGQGQGALPSVQEIYDFVRILIDVSLFREAIKIYKDVAISMDSEEALGSYLVAVAHMKLEHPKSAKYYCRLAMSKNGLNGQDCGSADSEFQNECKLLLVEINKRKCKQRQCESDNDYEDADSDANSDSDVDVDKDVDAIKVDGNLPLTRNHEQNNHSRKKKRRTG